MKMRRVVVEILVPEDEFASNAAVVAAVEYGVADATWGHQRDVYLLNDYDNLVEFTDEQWKLLKEDRGQVQLGSKVYGTKAWTNAPRPV
jgi:hypothetical protein